MRRTCHYYHYHRYYYFNFRWAWLLVVTLLVLCQQPKLASCTGDGSRSTTLTASAGGGGDDDDDDKVDESDLGVVVLTSTTFEKTISDSNVWLIEFYAPWCTHCMSFAPTYSEIARHFHSKPNLKVKVGKVDTTVQKALGQRFAVNAYPSFFVVHGSSVYEFEGSRSKNNLITFAGGGYKDQGAIPFYSSPMGPLGRLQGLLIWAGVSLIDVFQWLQKTTGLSPLLVGCLVCAGAVFGGMFLMIILVIFMTPREKVD